jgi:WD40 repeat protein
MLSGHNNNKVTSVSFNANGTILASSSIDGTINLWKTDGTLILTLNTKYAITSISFSPDSQTLVTGSEKGSLSLWNLNVDNLLTQSYTWLKDYLKNHPQS